MRTGVIVNDVSDKSSVGCTPSQIRRAYGIGEKGSGNGITVAVIDYIGNDNIQNNLTAFSEEFDLNNTVVEIVGEKNNSAYFNFSAYIEPTADVQWIHAVSPNADIAVIRASEFSVEGIIGANKTAVEYGADIILQTFQADFLPEYKKYEGIYQSNVVFVASAGDYGAGAFFPSCFPECISVGGTSLKISNDGIRESDEIVWSSTGGGICSYFDIPEYQQNYKDTAAITYGKRGVPDVAFLADPKFGYSVYHSSINGRFGWYSAGGTSLSAAVVAGLISNWLSIEKITDKKSVISRLYSLADSDYNKMFNDITRGNNGRFFAKIGYDLCTGLGSMLNF